MGNPSIYYKRYIRELIERVNEQIGEKEENLENLSQTDLENLLSKKKSLIEHSIFYFLAGVVSISINDEVYEQEGNDGFNACAGGFSEFLDFIGLEI